MITVSRFETVKPKVFGARGIFLVTIFYYGQYPDWDVKTHSMNRNTALQFLFNGSRAIVSNITASALIIHTHDAAKLYAETFALSVLESGPPKISSGLHRHVWISAMHKQKQSENFQRCKR